MISLVISLLRLPHNQIANVDSLPRPVISGGLHRADCLDVLQFAHICMDVFGCRRCLFAWESFNFCFGSISIRPGD
ncbi:hypothetical protein QL285_046228 [Trifolium repens]|nr:hypothetical protein QL285_046228 [Trifolium repens]